MLITRVTAQNFGCHPHFDQEFTSGICGILGKNGSGKSTVLDMIRFGITGELEAEGSKTDNVMWGANKASVTVHFTHGDGAFAISRTLGRGSGQKLVGPEGTLTRKTEIKEFIESICLTTTEAMLNNVFVPQGKIDSILFSTNTRRLKEIQETVGLQRASEAEKALGNEAARYTVTLGLEQQIQVANDSVEECRQKLSEKKERLAELDKEIQELQPFAELLDQLRKQLQDSVAVRQSEDRLQELRGELEEALNRLERVTKSRDSLRQIVEDTKQTTDDARSVLSQHEADKRAVQAAEDLKSQLYSVSTALSELGERPEGDVSQLDEQLEKLTDRERTRELQLSGKMELPLLPEDREAERRVEELSTEIYKLGHRTDNRSQLLKADLGRALREHDMFKSGECPTCGQDVGEKFYKEASVKIGDLREELRQLEEGYETQKAEMLSEKEALEQKVAESKETARKAVGQSLEKIRLRLREVRQLRTAIVQYEEGQHNLLQRKKMLEEQLSTSLPRPMSEEEVEKLRKQVSDYERTTIALAEQETESRAQVAAVERLEKQVESELTFRNELGETADTPDEEQVQEARKKAEILTARTQSRSSVYREVSSLEIQLEQYQATLESMHKTLKEESLDAAWVKVCKRAREALHVSGLPSLMMREYAAVLNRRIAHYLGIWGADFSVELDENLAFVASMDGGPSFSAARLSGGQKVVASTSFRLAMADTFARQVGLLILDEPSNHLDKDNIVQLQHLMLRLKELAGSTGRQVIMVDHEESLVGFFDHVITLDSLSQETEL